MGSVLCPSCGGGSATRLPNGDYACAGCLTIFPAPTAELVVPDNIGEVIGYRAWHVIDTPDGHRLASTGWGGKYSRQVWIPGEVCVAVCDNPHTCPDERCGCGFYAARTRDHLLSLNRYHLYDPEAAKASGGTGGHHMDAVAVIGQVAMDGKVIPASLGWRAQNAWPINVRVPHLFWRVVKPLQEAYGPYNVEVTLDNTLVMPEAETPKWCSKCGSKIKDRAPSCGTCGMLVSGGGVAMSL